jgi:hypothetical protein
VAVKKRVAAAGCALAGLVSSAAMAAGYDYGYGAGPEYGGLYFGASAGEAFYNEDGVPQLTPTVAIFRVGQQFSPYVAIEGRVGTSVSGGGYNLGYHADLQAIYGGYVKGILPLSPWFSAYAIAGLGGAQIHRNYPEFNSNDVGISYGVGAEFNVGGGATLNAEWSRLTNGTNDGYNYNADLLTFGVNWHPWY